jgi:hypothetical protein
MSHVSISGRVGHAGIERVRGDGLGDLAPAAGILLGAGISLILWQGLILLALWAFR